MRSPSGRNHISTISDHDRTNGRVDIYLEREHRGQLCEEGLELVADGRPQVAGGVHGESLHEGGDVLQAVQHCSPCWQTLLVVQTLQDRRANQVIQ